MEEIELRTPRQRHFDQLLNGLQENQGTKGFFDRCMKHTGGDAYESSITRVTRFVIRFFGINAPIPSTVKSMAEEIRKTVTPSSTDITNCAISIAQALNIKAEDIPQNSEREFNLWVLKNIEKVREIKTLTLKDVKTLPRGFRKLTGLTCLQIQGRHPFGKWVDPILLPSLEVLALRNIRRKWLDLSAFPLKAISLEAISLEVEKKECRPIFNVSHLRLPSDLKSLTVKNYQIDRSSLRFASSLNLSQVRTEPNGTFVEVSNQALEEILPTQSTAVCFRPAPTVERSIKLVTEPDLETTQDQEALALALFGTTDPNAAEEPTLQEKLRMVIDQMKRARSSQNARKLLSRKKLQRLKMCTTKA